MMRVYLVAFSLAHRFHGSSYGELIKTGDLLNKAT